MERARRVLVALAHDDRAEWDLSSRQALAVVAIPVAVVVIGLLAAPFRDVYHLLANEDGIVEWAQIALLIALIPLAARLAIELWHRGDRWLAMLYVLVGGLALFVAGEEVSWGQRIIGFATPEAIDEVNRQGETNIHNIGGLLFTFNIAVLAASLWALLMPIARWTIWRDRTRGVAGFALIPPAVLMTAFAVPVVYRTIRLTLLPDAGERITMFQEFSELCFYIGSTAFVYLILRAVRRLPARDDQSSGGEAAAPARSERRSS